jgi:hypothetical protein
MLAGVGLLVLAGSASSENLPRTDGKKDQSAQAPVESAAADSGHVGTETCKTCHEDLPSKDFFKNYESSSHYVTTLDTKKGPEWHGCESCHGPGKAHVEGGGDKSKVFSFKNASAIEISNRWWRATPATPTMRCSAAFARRCTGCGMYTFTI